ncbi:MAG: hypothetical protein L6Q84_20135 [Polyangiaceae bacterium]|nr:hypothetical protein [Polyangiaceae bacterium]
MSVSTAALTAGTRAALIGDAAACRGLLSALEEARDATSRAWARVIRSELDWVAAEPSCRVQSTHVRELLAAAPASCDAAMALVGCAARSAMLDFDGAALAELGSMARALRGQPAPELALTGTWVEALAGLHQAGASELDLEHCTREASRAGLAALVVELTSTRALMAAHEGATEPALALARRASMMARSEGIPRVELWANLVLARVRRLAGQPHLGLRILQSLGASLPGAWRAWLDWERQFCGVRGVPAPSGDAPCEQGARAVHALLCAAALSDCSGALRAVDALAGDNQLLFAFRREALELAGALLPSVPAATHELERFRAGRSPAVPPALSGLRFRDDDDGSAQAYVIAAPGAEACRVLHWGVGLIDAGDWIRVPASHRTKGRVETLLAVLALAGPSGLDEADCFREVYGFAFVPELHRSAFNVLQHRARVAVPECEAVKEVGRLRLGLASRAIIPDPRVCQRVSDRVLQLLAQRGAASAKAAADALGISLRSAQGALAELAGAGACEPKREGRNVEYVLEDTVFSEPTRRLMPR